MYWTFWKFLSQLTTDLLIYCLVIICQTLVFNDYTIYLTYDKLHI